MKRRRWDRERVIYILIFCFICGCYYPKVQLTRSERKLIAYDKQKRPIIFCSEAGVCDTIKFHYAFTRNGYNPNFDQWWDIHISHTARKGSHRRFYYSVIGTSNFPVNKYTDKNLNLLFVKLSLIKTENDSAPVLSMDGFSESYVINEKTKRDTLVFSDFISEGTCPSGRCLRKAFWTANQGLVSLEKYDDSVWKRK